jgi:hypothetical protein
MACSPRTVERATPGCASASVPARTERLASARNRSS